MNRATSTTPYINLIGKRGQWHWMTWNGVQTLRGTTTRKRDAWRQARRAMNPAGSRCSDSAPGQEVAHSE
jgi:hypothetical protein